MADLMAEVSQERSVRFVHRQTTFLALGVVGLGHVNGDPAFIVAGKYLRAVWLRRVGQELKSQSVAGSTLFPKGRFNRRKL